MSRLALFTATNQAIRPVFLMECVSGSFRPPAANWDYQKGELVGDPPIAVKQIPGGSLIVDCVALASTTRGTVADEHPQRFRPGESRPTKRR